MTFWGITVQNWYLLAQIIALLLGTGFIGTVVNWCYKTYSRVSQTFLFVEKLEKELKPNGGSSLRDQINRIETQLNYIKFAQHTYWDHNTDVAMFATDTIGHCNWANKALCELLHRQIIDFLGTAWEVSISQEEREEVRVEWYRAVAEQRPFDMTYNMVDSHGQEIPVRCKAFGSNKTGYVGFIIPLP